MIHWKQIQDVGFGFDFGFDFDFDFDFDVFIAIAVEGDFTSYGDEIKNLSTICVKTIDNTKTDRLSIQYLSYLNPEEMHKQRRLIF